MQDSTNVGHKLNMSKKICIRKSVLENLCQKICDRKSVLENLCQKICGRKSVLENLCQKICVLSCRYCRKGTCVDILSGGSVHGWILQTPDHAAQCLVSPGLGGRTSPTKDISPPKSTPSLTLYLSLQLDLRSNRFSERFNLFKILESVLLVYSLLTFQDHCI